MSYTVSFNANGTTTFFDANGIRIAKPEEWDSKIQELQAAEPMRILRLQRDQLLASTDWWVLPDRTVTQAQLDYRQALRDLPANSSPKLDENGNLINVQWPEKPE